MTRIRTLRLVLPARFARVGPAAAREIAERLADAGFEHQMTAGSVRLADTGQTAAQIGLQAGQTLRGRIRGEGDGS